MNANNVMEGGRPIICPLICAFWLFAYRVKSGMFKESVAQKPTIPVNAGKKYAQNAEPVNFAGWESIGPNPLPALIAQNNNANAAKGKKNALKTNNFLMLSIPK